MTPWHSPLPPGLPGGARVFRPGEDLRRVASTICEKAWKGQGVRVFRWPCGTLAMATVGSLADAFLLRECMPELLCTYARHGLLRGVAPWGGPLLVDVLHDLNWARAR